MKIFKFGLALAMLALSSLTPAQLKADEIGLRYRVAVAVDLRGCSMEIQEIFIPSLNLAFNLGGTPGFGGSEINAFFTDAPRNSLSAFHYTPAPRPFFGDQNLQAVIDSIRDKNNQPAIANSRSAVEEITVSAEVIEVALRVATLARDLKNAKMATSFDPRFRSLFPSLLFQTSLPHNVNEDSADFSDDEMDEKSSSRIPPELPRLNLAAQGGELDTSVNHVSSVSAADDSTYDGEFRRLLATTNPNEL